jgi:hypothetical protein
MPRDDRRERERERKRSARFVRVYRLAGKTCFVTNGNANLWTSK